jgi:dTDP-4-amino-4,6-dideoxygalactose transaminase
MIKFLDVQAINARFENEFQEKFKEFLNSGQYILGQEVEVFESNYANYCGTSHCIGTSNGLDALILIFKAYIQLGVLKTGDEVLVPANTYIASILSVIHSGLTPIFVEPSTKTFNISPEEIKKQITSKTRAVLVVHLYGQLADMERINAIAKMNKLLVIEDAAQAHGAIDNEGLIAGNLADAGAFSFYPSKNFGALGDAGAVTTNNAELANAVRELRNYGSKEKYVNSSLGYNNRMDTIQAAFLNIKLPILDNDNNRRREIAGRYLSEIHNKKIKLPFYDESKNHVFHVFVILVDNRSEFIKYLKRHDIETLIHYPIPSHKQEALTSFNHLSLPVTEYIHENIVSIPISPVITDIQVDQIINLINTY